MKKILALMLALCMVFALAACGEAASDPSAAPESEAPASEAPASEAPASEEPAADGEFTTIVEGKLTMSTNAQFPPYEMTTDDGGFEGIDVEMATEIANRLGLELQIDDMDFDYALQAVQQGKSDIAMAGITVNKDRLVNMDFSNTYANGVQVVIVPEDSDIASIDDLQGKMIGVQRGTTGDSYCSAAPEEGGFGEDHVTQYDNGMTAVQALINGQVDAVVIDNAPAEELVKANQGLKILDTAYTDEDYAIAVAKGNTQLLDAINSILADMEADGTTQAIIDKYINAD